MYRELKQANTKPNIDVELILSFKPNHCQPKFKEGKGNYRMDFASQWMDLITQRIQADLDLNLILHVGIRN